MSQSVYVDRFFVMDPEFDDLLPDGTFLKNDMIVLLEDHFLRGDPGQEDNPWEMARVRKNNRWCTVTHLKLTPRGGSPLVSFIGVYADGTKAKQTFDASYAWYVKKESI